MYHIGQVCHQSMHQKWFALSTCSLAQMEELHGYQPCTVWVCQWRHELCLPCSLIVQTSQWEDEHRGVRLYGLAAFDQFEYITYKLKDGTHQTESHHESAVHLYTRAHVVSQRLLHNTRCSWSVTNWEFKGDARQENLVPLPLTEWDVVSFIGVRRDNKDESVYGLEASDVAELRSDWTTGLIIPLIALYSALALTYAQMMTAVVME